MKVAIQIDPHDAFDAPTHRPFQRVTAAAQKHLIRAMGLVAARLLRPSALLDTGVRSAVWRAGLAVQPKGFYSSLVDPRDLARSIPRSGYAGVDFNQRLQLHYLSEVFPRFQEEYAQLPRSRPDDWETNPRFFLGNDAFNGVDALAYWAMVRFHRPKKIVEVGSGN